MTKEEAVVAKLLEYDMKLTKLKEMLGLNSKNSSKPGTFMSRTVGKIFARIKGYISTVKKNGHNVMDELQNVFRGETFVPVLGR